MLDCFNASMLKGGITMAEQKLRIGVIGVGMFACYFHVPQLRATGRAEIVALCRRNPERLAMASEFLGVERTFTDWRAMLAEAELDAVVISTTHDQHFQPCKAALERGLHVLIDKPLALSSAEAWQLVDIARRKDRVSMQPGHSNGYARSSARSVKG
jgi:predicted dehydrogenase